MDGEEGGEGVFNTPFNTGVGTEEGEEGDGGERECGGTVVSRRGRLSEGGDEGGTSLALTLSLAAMALSSSAVVVVVVVAETSPCESSPSPCPRKLSDCVTRSSMRSRCSCARASLRARQRVHVRGTRGVHVSDGEGRGVTCLRAKGYLFV